MINADVRLSLLDRSRTRSGETDGAALRGTVARATRAEQLGYHRFWVAEHHGVPGIAGAAPAPLLTAVAGATTVIRLGSAGVMLPHHQPLVVADIARQVGDGEQRIVGVMIESNLVAGRQDVLPARR